MNVESASKTNEKKMCLYYRMSKKQGQQDLVSTIDEIINEKKPGTEKKEKMRARIKRVGQFPEDSSSTSSSTSSSSSPETSSEESKSPKPCTSKGLPKMKMRRTKKKAKKAKNMHKKREEIKLMKEKLEVMEKMMEMQLKMEKSQETVKEDRQETRTS